MTFMLLSRNDHGFSTVPWSALTTLIMMSGEIDYRDAFLDSQSSVYILQCAFLVLFFLVMGIVVMNVFVGLAVGDTEEMMKRSKDEKPLHEVSKTLNTESKQRYTSACCNFLWTHMDTLPFVEGCMFRVASFCYF